MDLLLSGDKLNMKRRRTTRHSLQNQTKMLDRISELPEPIVHYIMSFLPTKDATRISALSKRFRSVCASFPIIDFDENLILKSSIYKLYGKRRKNGELLSYIHDFILRRESNIMLQKFRLHVSLYENNNNDNAKLEDPIDGAILYALEKKVKELDLDVAGQNQSFSFFYSLPLAVLSAKSIMVLKLKGFKIESQDLILSYPFVEDLSLQDCYGMKTLKVLCEKLKIMAIDFCGGLEEIDLETPNLESFSYSGLVLPDGELESCKINMVACKSLKNLSLVSAQITDRWLNEVFKFLLLEDLKVRSCKFFKNLCICSPTLKTMHLKHCLGLEIIEVVAPNLESFIYNSDEFKPCVIDIIACKCLKNMTIKRAEITDSWLQGNVQEFPLLENMKLCGCSMLEKFKISHQKLKKVQLLECNKLNEVEIDTRNLDSFVYSGHSCQLLPSFLLVDSPGVAVELSLESETLSENWFSRLRNFLKFFGHCRELKLVCPSEKVLIVPKDLRNDLISPLYDLKRLKVEISARLEDLTNLIDSLLWLAPHTDIISIVWGSHEKSLKFRYAIPATADEDLFCCYTRPIKCWRHYLKEVVMENFGAKEIMAMRKFFRNEAMRLEAIYDITRHL